VKAALFIAAGAWLTSLGTKQLDGLRGAARRNRGVGGAAVVAALALAGVPPLSLWATKDEVLAGVDGLALHVVALAAAAVSAAYAGKILAVVLAAPAPDTTLDREQALDREEPGTRRVPVAATTAAGVLAAAAAGLGLFAVPAVAEEFRAVLDASGQPAPGVGDLVLSAVLALVVLAVVVRRPGLLAATETTALARWAGLGRLLSGAPVLRLARAAARIDDRGLDRAVLAGPTAVRRLAAALGGPGERIVDGGVEGLVAMTGRAGRTAARSDLRDVDGVVRVTVAGLRRSGSLARRPQTGLLHQYYAQAMVGLAALLVVLIVVR
jgi:NADH:ubiquinone oxidoreductase subunit 5 (subunit L)/multisubunit Na+/H+ antiporter MnhA subunit